MNGVTRSNRLRLLVAAFAAGFLASYLVPMLVFILIIGSALLFIMKEM